MPFLDRDHAAGLVARQYLLQVVDGAVAEVAGVLDVEGDGRRAPQLVADVLALDRDALPARLEAVLDLLRQQAVQLQLGQPALPDRVALDGSGVVVEVYPAAALRRWGLRRGGTRGRRSPPLAES